MRGRLRVWGLVVVAVGLVALTGGCGADESRVAAEPDLKGRLYVAVDAKAHRLVADREARLTIGDGVIDAFGGCNDTGTVAYALDHGRLKILPYAGGDLAGVGCREDIEQQDAWLDALLRSSPTVRVRDGGATLVLSTADEVATFEARARPQGRRVVQRSELDRYHELVEQLKGRVEARHAAINVQIEKGELTRREGRRRMERIFGNAERTLASARQRLKASER